MLKKKIMLLFTGILSIFIFSGGAKAENTAADDYGGSTYNCPTNFQIYSGDATYGGKYCCPKYFYDSSAPKSKIYIQKSGDKLYCVLKNYIIYNKGKCNDESRLSDCYAQAKPATAIIKFDANGGHSLSSLIPIIKKIGDKVGNMPSVSRTGYTFDGWYTSKYSGTKVTADTIVNKNTTYYAHWKGKKCVVAYNANNGAFYYDGKIDLTHIIESIDANTDNTTCTISGRATAKKEGYTFGGWNTSKYCTAGITSVSVGNTTTLYACLYKNI